MPLHKIDRLTATSRNIDASVEHRVRRAFASAKPTVPSEYHEGLLDAMVQEGLFPASSAVSQRGLQASADKIAAVNAAMADPRRSSFMRLALGHLSRAAIDIETAFDINALNREMTARGIPTQQRMEIKSALHCAGILE
jgi:hypothetical protein